MIRVTMTPALRGDRIGRQVVRLRVFAMPKVLESPIVQTNTNAYLGFMYVGPDYRGPGLNQHSALAHCQAAAEKQ